MRNTIKNLTQLNMTQLRKSLQQAVLPAEDQIARLKECDVPFEVADDVGNWITWILQWPDSKLTGQQRSSLRELASLLNHMSDKLNAHLWNEESLRSLPEWDEFRQKSLKVLQLFEWPLENADVPTDERTMLKHALRVAALPADQQIAKFPEGSPVSHWIAGDFFNWSGPLLRQENSAITDEQRSALSALDARLNEMSERHERDKELWTEEGLRSRPEWKEVRRDARKTLESFQWPLDADDMLVTPYVGRKPD